MRHTKRLIALEKVNPPTTLLAWNTPEYIAALMKIYGDGVVGDEKPNPLTRAEFDAIIARVYGENELEVSRK